MVRWSLRKSCDSAIPPLGMFPKELNTVTQMAETTRMSVNRRLSTQQNSLPPQRAEAPTQVTTWKNLENNLLNERRQIQRPHTVSYLHGVSRTGRSVEADGRLVIARAYRKGRRE